MQTSTRAVPAKPDGASRLWSLLGLFSGGILFQAAGGCQTYLSSAVDAMGQPLATGIGNGLSNVVQALVVGVFI